MSNTKHIQHPLRKERLGQGWSQQQLADFAGVSLSTVERAERAEPIRIDSIQRLCACLGKKPEQLGLLQVVQTVHPEEPPTGETGVKQNHDIEGCDDMNRREAMQKIGKMVGATSVFLMMPQTLLNTDDLERLAKALTKPSCIDIETITGLQKTNENYWRLRIRGSVARPDLLDATTGLFQVIINLLQQCSLPTVRTRLCAVASETSQLVGRLLLDMSDYDTAQYYYKDALIVAQQSNNDAVYAAGLGRLGMILATTGKPQDALLLLESAHRIVADSDQFMLRSWLAAELAETQAEVQNGDACFESLEHATLSANQIRTDEYAYGESFDASRLPAYEGVCYVRLRQPHLALPALQTGLKTCSLDGLTMSILLDIAEASIQVEEIEQACDYIQQALEIVARLQTGRSAKRAYKLRQQMEPWAKVQAVKDVDERFMLFKGVV